MLEDEELKQNNGSVVEEGLQEWSGVARLLMKHPIFRKLDGEDRWTVLERNIRALSRWFSTVGFEIVLDRNDCYAYLKSADLEEGSKLPCITARHQIKGKAAILAVMLRREAYGHTVSASLSEWPILTRSEIHDMLKVLQAQVKDHVSFNTDTDNAIRILTKLYVLHSLSKKDDDTSVSNDDRFEVTPLIKAVVDISAMHAMLRSIGLESTEEGVEYVSEEECNVEPVMTSGKPDESSSEPSVQRKRGRKPKEPEPVQGDLFDVGGDGKEEEVEEKEEVTVVSEEEISVEDDDWEEDDE